MRALFIFLAFAILAKTVAIQKTQMAMLHDLNSDHDRRHLDAGLPSYLYFNLQHDAGDVSLELSENIGLNPNAPVYEAVTDEDGMPIVVQKDTPAILTEKFYQDFGNDGSFSVQCQVDTNGPCRRVLTGNLFIDGKHFDIVPATETWSKRGLEMGDSGTPHLLIENEMPAEGFLDDSVLEDLKRKNFDGDMLQPENDDSAMIFEDEESLQEAVKKIQQDIEGHRAKRSTKEQWTVEIFLILDTILYERWYNGTAATATRTRAEETEDRLKRHGAQIINGVDLRYKSIEDIYMQMSATLSGYLIVNETGANFPRPASHKYGTDKRYHADIVQYYDEHVIPWIANTTLPEHDHIMLISGYQLYLLTEGKQSDGILGVANIGRACTETGLSMVEDQGGHMFLTILTATHEMGHSLGSRHDGEAVAQSCKKQRFYIMTSKAQDIIDDGTYSVNNWRFSQCSVDQIKVNMVVNRNNAACLKDDGHVYNATEYAALTSTLPGEITDHDAQCKAILGASSTKCGTTSNVCSFMKCTGASGSCQYTFRAAEGTWCGVNKWCIEGACVSRNPVSFGGCLDLGVAKYACSSLRKMYDGLEEFCYHWKKRCCQSCSNIGVTYRLVDSRTGVTPSKYAGRVEVFYNGVWGTICNDNFLDVNAQVVCKSLGFSGGELKPGGFYGQGEGQIWMADVLCDGREDGLGFCGFMGWGKIPQTCNHAKDVSIKCAAPAGDCVDIGWGADNSCQKMIALLPAFGKTTATACSTIPDWPKKCCKTCAAAALGTALTGHLAGP